MRNEKPKRRTPRYSRSPHAPRKARYMRESKSKDRGVGRNGIPPSDDARFAALETELEIVTASIEKLSTAVERHTQQVWDTIDSLRESITGLRDIVAKANQPNWATWAAMGGVLLTIVVLVGRMGIAPLELAVSRTADSMEKMEEQQNDLRETINDHLRLPVHPVAAESLRDMQREIDALTNAFQLTLKTNRLPEPQPSQAMHP